MIHIPVLLQQVLEFLSPKPNQNFIDATAGEGGYTKEILKLNSPGGKVVAIDWNIDAIEELKINLPSKRLIPVCGNFSDLEKIVSSSGAKEIHGIVFDLGLSKFLLEKSGRGFSFRKDEPLKMNFDKESKKTAEQIINHYSEEDLEKLFRDYGQERFSKRIAEAIVRARPIVSSFELAKIIEKAVPSKQNIHPATRIFQALRIAVNDEFGNLKKALPEAINLIAKDGRVAVVSYHSLEDKIVKNIFREEAKMKKVEILTKKPVGPGRDEIKKNPSSRSAKLRVVKKII